MESFLPKTYILAAVLSRKYCQVLDDYLNCILIGKVKTFEISFLLITQPLFLKNIIILTVFSQFWTRWNHSRFGKSYNVSHLPQNGIPCGTHVPLLLHTLLAGPSSSNPLSQEYLATVPLCMGSWLNSTLLWAGAPGKAHPWKSISRNRELFSIFTFFRSIKNKT